MKKEEYIARYGEAAWEKMLEQRRAWYNAHREEVIANHQEEHRKGGIYYEKHLEYQQTGLPGERNRIRRKHQKQYHPLKMIIAPDSQLHHQWKPESAEYTGVALVEATPHQYGIIDVIQILDGEITLLAEEEVREGGETNG
jgi:hypothetical protein